jgi:hypothetical protein
VKFVVFAGPTIPHDEARHLLDAEFLPPASQGDVLRAARGQPWGIGIIDGYFQSVPSVWHKEILWAMSNGVHVYGASSMGALRAVELESFGMVGVGSVFEAFRSGSLEDDDEVAVVHGPAEAGYFKGSDALVNIRATLASAAGQGVISEETRASLTDVAKRLFYPDRRYDRVLADGAAAGVSNETCERLRGWLPFGRVDVKRDDALALLTRMASDAAFSSAPKQVSYYFHETVLWSHLWSQSAPDDSHARAGTTAAAGD